MAHIAEKIDFKQGSKRSMESTTLRKALYKATDLFRAQRAATMTKTTSGTISETGLGR